MKVSVKALQILEQYKHTNPKHDLVFPDLEKLDDLSDSFVVKSYIKARVKASNEQLPNVAKAAKTAKTEKDITMHIARHTFGNLSGDKIPVQMLQKLYRHSSITTTIGYQSNFINKDADDALDAVIGF